MLLCWRVVGALRALQPLAKNRVPCCYPFAQGGCDAARVKAGVRMPMYTCIATRCMVGKCVARPLQLAYRACLWLWCPRAPWDL